MHNMCYNNMLSTRKYPMEHLALIRLKLLSLPRKNNQPIRSLRTVSSNDLKPISRLNLILRYIKIISFETNQLPKWTLILLPTCKRSYNCVDFIKMRSRLWLVAPAFQHQSIYFGCRTFGRRHSVACNGKWDFWYSRLFSNEIHQIGFAFAPASILSLALELLMPVYGVSPFENISHTRIPYDQTSHSVVYLPKFNASGAVHLIGICFMPSETVWSTTQMVKLLYQWFACIWIS